MDSPPCTPTYSGPQRLMLDRVIAAVSADRRIEAVLGAGSLANGGFDTQSDFDFVVVGDVPAAGRRAFAGAMGTLLTAFTGEHVGDPDLLICLYGRPPRPTLQMPEALLDYLRP